jgi:hypothetical protein
MLMLALPLTLSVTIADGNECYSRCTVTGVPRVIRVVNYACLLGVFPRFFFGIPVIRYPPASERRRN